MDENEKQEQLKQQAFDRKRAAAFEAMMKTEGWKYFCDLIEQNLAQKAQILMLPLDTRANAVERQEFEKGAMFGLNFAWQLPTSTIQAQATVRTTNAEEDEE